MTLIRDLKKEEEEEEEDKEMAIKMLKGISCYNNSQRTVHAINYNSTNISNHSNSNNKTNNSSINLILEKNPKVKKVMGNQVNIKNVLNMISLLLGLMSIMTVNPISVSAKSTPIYSNKEIAKPSFEPLCHTQQEHFIESDGKDSSLILEFNSQDMKGDHKSSCTRILSAPTNYGFILRLILPKLHLHSIHRLSDGTTILEDQHDNEMDNSQINDMTTLIEKLNATANKPLLRRTCPLSVFSSLDPRTPQWRVDPCHLEDTAPEMEDPVRLFQGRVRVVWEHNDFNLNSKLMVTALGKGDQCRLPNKHPCLKIGDEPILCISKDLVCDGIRHCPNSNEYDSDEDCWKKDKFDGSLPMTMESGLFEHFALEVFRNLFAFDIQQNQDRNSAADNADNLRNVASKQQKDKPDVQYVNITTTLRKVPKTDMTSLGSNHTEIELIKVTVTNTTSPPPTNVHHRRNSTRNGAHSDLSKYGPWGYLMLGMLLCGGALLICGLWASASQQAANNERESAMASTSLGHGPHNDHSGVTGGPPTYEELDPPPAYSVLFPNQKSDSSTTLNNIANNSSNLAAIVAPLSPSARPACSGAASSLASSPPTANANDMPNGSETSPGN